ncbi:MAG TPA: glutamate--cysteine ligase [Rubrobacteraceae bacterium]|nr:glutamate--cysteine ligase [Rubrobacteraceae bacterium]
METNFGGTKAYTVGVEEEFQLVDPVTRELSPAIDEILAAGNRLDWVTSELSQSCVELVSPIFENVAQLGKDLPTLRRKLGELARGCGVELAAAGTHPFSNPVEQPFTRGEHHLKVEEQMGWVARTQAIYGLHVHVAVPDEEAAIQAMGVLSRHVPLMIALSGNSPFWRGSDTRLSSTRIKVFEIFPRSGLPPAFNNWSEFESHVETLVASGNIPDYSWCWWDVRPHPRFGTVELRSPDVQTNLSSTVSLAALVQCLVAAAEGRDPENPLLTEENKWLATRHGLDAVFYDFADGKKIEARALARRLVEELRPVSQELGCESELEGVLEIVARGSGAELQRSVFKRRGSLVSVVEHLVRATSSV